MGTFASLVAWPLLLGNLDDLFILAAWLAGAGRRPSPLGGGGAPNPRIAIFVGCWRESAVIGQMLDDNARNILYDNYRIYVGLYPNDPETIGAVRDAAAVDSRIRLAIGSRPGGTTKGDNLNTIYARMVADEEECGERFDAVVIHDAEDRVDKEELSVIARALGRWQMIQLPVLALATERGWIRAIYSEDFAYGHAVDLPVRAALGGFVPSAGVGTAYRRDLLDRMAAHCGGRPFETGSLTEDYESGLLAAQLGARQVFLPILDPNAAPVSELFPDTFRQAVRQRARWVRGICLQAWARHGWGRGARAYWFVHDRKALVLSPLGLGAMVWCGWNVAEWIAGSGGDPLWGNPVMLANWAASALIALGRAAVSARVHGMRFGLGFPVRMLAGAVVNAAAVGVAVWNHLSSSRARVDWDKTEHTYPPADHPGTGRASAAEILAAMKGLTPGQVASAKATCAKGGRLAEQYVVLGWATEKDLTEAYRRQSGLGLAGGSYPLSRVSRIFSAEMAIQYHILPIAVEKGEIVVAATAPPGESLEELVRARTRLKVRWELVTRSDWEQMARAVL